MAFGIAAGNQLTRDTAHDVIKAGGNAFDAAIAAYAVMFISEPAMASAGAGGFATCFSEKSGFNVFDFFSQTPLKKWTGDKLDYFPIHIQFSDTSEEFHVGLGSATVPGAIAGMFKIHEHYGTIPIAELFQPAIHHCKQGVALDDFQAYDLDLLQDILRTSQTGIDIFFENDKIKSSGEIITMPLAADLLESLAIEGPGLFYRGEIASSIANDCLVKGAHLTRADFENYRVHVHSPMQVQYGAYTIASPGLPSIGSYGLALYLGMQKIKGLTDTEALIYTAEHIRDKFIVLEQLKELFGENYKDYDPSLFSTKGTSHFSIVDKESNAISLTTSIGEGCGYFIPNTQMHMNNMLGETYLLAGGAHSWSPNVRLNSMMTPTIVLKDDNLFCVTGSGGASRIPVAIKQVLTNLIDENLNLEGATESERTHFQENTLHLENGRTTHLPEGNYDIKSWSMKSLFFGGVNSVYVKEKGILEAWSDQRRLGSAGVYN